MGAVRLCMAGGPGQEPVWRSGPGHPDHATSVRKRVVYTALGPKSVVRGPLRGPGLPIQGPKPNRLHVFGPKPCTPDVLAPIFTPAPDLAPRPYATVWTTPRNRRLLVRSVGGDRAQKTRHLHAVRTKPLATNRQAYIYFRSLGGLPPPRPPGLGFKKRFSGVPPGGPGGPYFM